jgi:hypothetical protein
MRRFATALRTFASQRYLFVIVLFVSELARSLLFGDVVFRVTNNTIAVDVDDYIAALTPFFWRYRFFRHDRAIQIRILISRLAARG